jgi:5-methyltetrahydropteroyltriglutamate--homocysteine methyltransferase
MSNRVLTSHAGSLPRPDDLRELNQKRMEGESVDEQAYGQKLAEATAEVVARQREVGVDLVNDGEYGHAMGHLYDYGSWWTYIFQRLGGLELVQARVLEVPQPKPKPGEIGLATFAERRDWNLFAEAYGDPSSGAALPTPPEIAPMCRGPITYTGQEAIQRDIANFKAALDAAGVKAPPLGPFGGPVGGPL